MPAITVSVSIAQPVASVWEELADLGRHHHWMTDASSIGFIGPRRAGVGTTMRVPTRVGPFRIEDVLVVTAWEEHRLLAVDHRGLVKGRGEFRLSGNGDVTLVTWKEDLSLPWYLGGAVTMWVARPVLRRVFLRNLARLRQRLVTGR